MLPDIEDFKYNRRNLLGRPNLSLENASCRNITCKSSDKFKKYKPNIYICECGYILEGEYNIKEQHKIKLYCMKGKCIFGKEKMNKGCFDCEHLGER